MRKSVLLTDPVHPDAMALLEGEVDVLVASEELPLAEQVKSVHGLLARRRIAPEVLEAGDALEVVARHGVGLDFIPVERATTLHIPVVYAPNSNAISVAEHTMAMMLALAKDLCGKSAATKLGRWTSARGLCIELADKTVGVVGLGRIGSRVARICRSGFGMRVLGFDPMVDAAEAEKRGAERVPDLADLLRQSDFITLHVPLTQGTRGLIGGPELATMKPTAFLINAARGELVDEDALRSALAEHRIAGAAIDVMVQDPPPPDHPLLSLPNIIVTPHSAALTQEAMVRMGMDSAGDILRVLRGEMPISLANPEVWQTRRSL